MSPYGDVPLFWVLFGVFLDFWVHFWGAPGFLGTFWTIPGFLSIILLIKFDFFRNNPDSWVLILIFC